MFQSFTSVFTQSSHNSQSSHIFLRNTLHYIYGGGLKKKHFITFYYIANEKCDNKLK